MLLGISMLWCKLRKEEEKNMEGTRKAVEMENVQGNWDLNFSKSGGKTHLKMFTTKMLESA